VSFGAEESSVDVGGLYESGEMLVFGLAPVVWDVALRLGWTRGAGLPQMGEQNGDSSTAFQSSAPPIARWLRLRRLGWTMVVMRDRAIN